MASQLSWDELSIEFASTYNSLKPNCQPLLQQVLFPLLSITPAEQEEFEDDPVNFVRSQFGRLGRLGFSSIISNERGCSGASRYYGRVLQSS